MARPEISSARLSLSRWPAREAGLLFESGRRPVNPMFCKKLAIILMVGAATRLWLVFTAAGINSDAYRYALTAERMAEQGLVSGMRGDFLWPYYPLNRNLVVYPFLGSVVYRVTGDAILALRLVSALAGTALIWVLYAVAMELFGKQSIALLSAALVGLHPEFARASASVYREVLMALFLALAFLLLLRMLRSRQRWHLWALGAGLTLFVAFMTRPEGAIAAVAFVVIVLFVAREHTWRRRLATCLVMTLAFCVLEVPYVLWMEKVSGHWLLTQYQIQFVLRPQESLRLYRLAEEPVTNGAGEQPKAATGADL